MHSPVQSSVPQALIWDWDCSPKTFQSFSHSQSSFFFSPYALKALFRSIFASTQNAFFLSFDNFFVTSEPFITSPYSKSKLYRDGLKRWAPGSMNMRRKNCILLPAAARRTHLFHLIFTESGVYLLGHPCICFCIMSCQMFEIYHPS